MNYDFGISFQQVPFRVILSLSKCTLGGFTRRWRNAQHYRDGGSEAGKEVNLDRVFP